MLAATGTHVAPAVRAASSGLDPTQAVGLALISVALGAVLAGWVRSALDKAAEHRRFQAALWSVLDDLGRMSAALALDQPGALGVKQSAFHLDPEGLTPWLTSSTWEKERVTLAQGLRDEIEGWNSLRGTMATAEILIRLYRNRKDGDSNGFLRMVATHDGLAEIVEKTAATLAPLADTRERPRRIWHWFLHLGTMIRRRLSRSSPSSGHD